MAKTAKASLAKVNYLKLASKLTLAVSSKKNKYNNSELASQVNLHQYDIRTWV